MTKVARNHLRVGDAFLIWSEGSQVPVEIVKIEIEGPRAHYFTYADGRRCLWHSASTKVELINR